MGVSEYAMKFGLTFDAKYKEKKSKENCPKYPKKIKPVLSGYRFHRPLSAEKFPENSVDNSTENTEIVSEF